MEEFAEYLRSPKSWKEYLELPIPPLPEELVNNFGKLYGLPLPPLEELCPLRIFTVQPWNPSITRWCSHLPDAPPPEWEAIFPMPHFGTLSRVVCDQKTSFIPSFRSPFSVGISRVEGAVYKLPNRKPAAILINDVLNLPHRLDLVLDRLFSYMKLSNVCYGAVTCWSSTWLCKVELDATGNPLMLVSPPHDRMGMAFGFLASTAVSEEISFPRLPRTVSALCMIPFLRYLPLFADMSSNENIQRLVYGATTLCMDDLEDIKYLPGNGVARIHKSQVSLRAKYMGRQVVVRTRDLTSPYLLGFHGALALFVKDFHAYTVLRNIQGKVVPKLISWGFMEGGMFAFMMMEDGGKSHDEAKKDGEAWLPERKAALDKALEALEEIHKRGILVGDMSVSKLVVKKHEDGEWKLMIVGFGQSKQVRVLSSEWYDALIEEGKQLKEIVRELKMSEPPRPLPQRPNFFQGPDFFERHRASTSTSTMETNGWH